MIQFDKAKLHELKGRGKKGAMLWKLHIVAEVNEAVAKALGDDLRNTLYKTNGVIRPSFGKTDLLHVFSDTRFHLVVTGVKNAELLLDGVMAHKFSVASRGDGDKKVKRLLCGFEVEYIDKQNGTSSIDLWNFARSYSGAVGSLKLKYPEQQPMFPEGKEKPAPPITAGLHRYDNKGKGGKVTAEIQVAEVKAGWAATRKARVGSRTLPQKAPYVSASESEAIALAAYDVRTFADKLAGAKGLGVAKKEVEALSTWAQSFASGATDLAKAGAKEAAKTVPITRHTS